MKKNVSLFFAIIAVIAFFSCGTQEEKNTLSWTKADSAEVKANIKTHTDSLLEILCEKEWMDAHVILSEPLRVRSNSDGTKEFVSSGISHPNYTKRPVASKAYLPKTQPKPRRSNVSGISLDLDLLEEIMKNRQSNSGKESYHISCDSVCRADTILIHTK